ncbi:MAG: phage tail protein, partial [Oscillospiraceae bacterium]
MGYFSKFLMTDAGAALIAKLNVAKKPLTYSKVQFGDGFLGSTPVSALTALKNMVLESGIVSLKQRAQPGRWDVTGLLDNQTLKSDFYFREWGVFAFDPDTNAHVLVLYTNSGDRAELIPAGGGANIIQRQETAAYTIGTATTVTAVITPDFNFLTKEDLAAHNTEPTAHATELAKKADKTQV